MGRFSEKQLTIMTIVVSVVISGLFAALIYMDLGSIDEEEQQIQSLKGQIAGAEAKKAKIPGLEKDVIVYREIVKRDSSVLPDESEINKFINIIGDFEKYSGVVVTQVQGLSSGRNTSKEAILKIPLQLKVRGSMDQFLKFINLFENYERFVTVTGFTIAGGRSADEDGNVQHDIGLQLETYQYNPRGGAVTRVEIPNYERRKQELDIQKMIRQSKPAHIEKYQMKPRLSRRDPLVDPREAEVPDDAEGRDPKVVWEEQKQVLDKLVLDVNLLQDDVRVEEKLKKDHAFMRLAAVSKAIDQRVAQLDLRLNEVLTAKEITIPELKADFTEKVVNPFEKIKETRESNNGPTEILVDRKQVFDTLQKMKEMFEVPDYRAVIQVFEGFARATDGREFVPEALPLRDEMEGMVRQAQVISRFENEPLRIDGVIIDPKRTSYAIINGLILAEGDAVDSDGKIRIREIRPDSIIFEFEGVLIPKYIRKQK